MLLKLDHIGKIYNSNDLLVVGIRNVNLEFDYNEFVTIEGESGSGKSTLLNVIGANDTYEEGELWFNGSETSHFSENDWEKYREQNIATIFQDFNIIENLTVVENVELALFRLDDKKERRKVALDLIEKVGLSKQAYQRGSKLSGGEKQRTVIARALAKDSPIILADEPTGNLDVKASREIARILKEVSKDKLVIVVTHNPEFFKEYATRRVRVFDGHISEDKVIEKPKAPQKDLVKPEKVTGKWQEFKNTVHIGTLNYKSRPKFTLMMTVALFVCAITLFTILSTFGDSIIEDMSVTTDRIGSEGKLIISGGEGEITPSDLDKFAHITDARFALFNRQLSEFELYIPKRSGMLQSHHLICLYNPIKYNMKKGEAVLQVPKSFIGDGSTIADIIEKAEIGIEKVHIEENLNSTDLLLYFSNEDLSKNGEKISSIYSSVRFGENETRVYTFVKAEEIPEGKISVVNSVYYDALGKTVVFEAKAEKSYEIIDDKKKSAISEDIIIEMNPSDYDRMFASEEKVNQSCLYFENDEEAMAAAKLLPEGYLGMLSTGTMYLQNVGDIFTSNVLYYIALAVISILFGMLIVVIFMRSVKIYESDFAVYKTLGISRKISSASLYIEMFLLFLPTLGVLPLVSFIATVLPGSEVTFISFGNYVFIELMVLFIVEMVAFSFNKSMNKESIRKSLKRGSK